MKNYFLTIIGDFQTQEICREIAIGLTPIVDSPNLKFQHTKGILVFHFASEISKDEIYTFIYGVLLGITETFILTEIIDNFTFSFPNEIRGHLLDLENTSDDVKLKFDLNVSKKTTDNFDFEEDDEWVALIQEEREKFIKKPTLDQLLDKISSEGIESLTGYEKQTLQNYSKN